MTNVPAAWDERTPEWVVNATGRLTPAQITRVRTAIGQASLMNFTPMIVVMAMQNPATTVEHRLEAMTGPIAQALTVGWFIFEFGVLMLCVALMFRMLRWQLRATSEAKHGPIAHVEGTLGWRGRRYMAQAGDLRLRVLELAVAYRPPGTYRLHYLPRSRVVAAAERVGEPLPFAEWHSHHPVADQISLSFNREGRRSPLQASGRTFLPVVPFWALFIGSAIAAFFVHAPNDLYLDLAQIVFGVVAVTLPLRWRAFVDMRPGRVSSVEGTAERTARQRDTGVWEYDVTVGGQRVAVTKPIYDALAEPYRYRVYFATGDRWRKVLNAEPIGEIAAPPEIARA